MIVGLCFAFIFVPETVLAIEWQDDDRNTRNSSNHSHPNVTIIP